MRSDSFHEAEVVDLSSLSNADRGRLFFERARRCVEEVLQDPARRAVAVKGNRFSRAYLATSIGCKAAVPYQNEHIRQLLEEADTWLAIECHRYGSQKKYLRRVVRSRTGSPTSKDKCDELEDDNVVSLEDISNISTIPSDTSHNQLQRRTVGRSRGGGAWFQRLEDGIIVTSDQICMVKGRGREGIPTLIWPDGIDEVASDWFRYLIVVTDLAASTVHEYANLLRPFLRFCRREERDWRTVDDDFLIRWRDRLIVERVSTSRVNDSIQRVFTFYCWAEREGILRHHVGIYPDHELGPEWIGRKFPLTAVRISSKYGYGRSYLSWRSTIKARRGEQSSPMRGTPTEQQIQKLHGVVMGRGQAERNSLILSWAERTGARRAEILQVRVSQLPSLEVLAELIGRDEQWTIEVKRKGGRTKRMYVPHRLIRMSHEYVIYERSEVVSRCRREIKGYREPDHLFLSSKTGKVMHPDSVSAMGRKVFRKAGIEDANIHRLRARFAVRTIETLVDALFENKTIGAESNWSETILIKAAEMMGHAHPSSLKPYLNYVLNRRIQTSDAMARSNVQSETQQAKLQLDTTVRRLALASELGDAAEDIRGGDKASAAATLRRVADALEQEE